MLLAAREVWKCWAVRRSAMENTPHLVKQSCLAASGPCLCGQHGHLGNCFAPQSVRGRNEWRQRVRVHARGAFPCPNPFDPYKCSADTSIALALRLPATTARPMTMHGTVRNLKGKATSWNSELRFRMYPDVTYYYGATDSKLQLPSR